MTIKHLISRSTVLASVIAGTAIMTGCDTDNDKASLRVIHASPDAPAVNVYVERKTAITGLDYAASSGFRGVGTGNSDIRVEAIIPDGNKDVITVPDFPLVKDQRYTVIAVNETATIDAYVADESAASPEADEVAVAVVHASPAADAVDVYVTTPGTDITDINVLPDFTFDYRDPAVDAGALPAGTYDINVTLAGTKTIAYNISDVDLSPFGGQKLLLVAVSTTTDTNIKASPIKLLVATDDAQLVLLDEDTTAGARVVHASPDADAVAGGPVEVFTDANSPLGLFELIPEFTYTDIVPGFDSYVYLPAGDYIFDVAVNGAGPGTLYTSPVQSLSAGTEYTVIAAGLVGADPAFGLLVTEDDNRSIITQASVKVVHGAPAAGTVNVYVTPAGEFSKEDVENGLAGKPLLENFEFGDITDYVAVPPDNYDIRVVPLSLGVAAINVEDQPLAEGVVATVIARQPNDPAALPDVEPTDFSVILLTN
ncbi:MAG: DUF4397 domain-containing protein [Gammaproteobacteria bacterium]|nr:DUF4397 domain-containing protein [Gammaproteobacteria bacterium]